MQNRVARLDVFPGLVGLCVGSVECVYGPFQSAVVVCFAARVAHFWGVEFAEDNTEIFGLLGAGMRGVDVSVLS